MTKVKRRKKCRGRHQTQTPDAVPCKTKIINITSNEKVRTNSNYFYAVVRFLIVFSLVAGTYYAVWNLVAVSHPPRYHLKGFVDAQLAKMPDLSGIDQLPIDDVSPFAASACIQSGSLESAKLALRKQLQSIPADVASEIVDSCLIFETSVKNVVQNTTSPIPTTGKSQYLLVVVAHGIQTNFDL